jgi:hypothetical protein
MRTERSLSRRFYEKLSQFSEIQDRLRDSQSKGPELQLVRPQLKQSQTYIKETQCSTNMTNKPEHSPTIATSVANLSPKNSQASKSEKK